MTTSAPGDGDATTPERPTTEPTSDPTTTSTTTGRTDWTRRLRRFIRGLIVACVALPLLVEAIPFLSYTRVTLAVGLGGIVALHPKSRRVLETTTVAIALLSALIIFTPVMDWSVRALDVSVPPRQADVIVILGAGIHCRTGNLDATSVARTITGVALWKKKFAPEVTISDSDRSILGSCPSQAQVTRNLIESLVGRNGPPVVVLPRMTSTRTEAKAVADLQEARKWKSVMVVTSPTHTRRALSTFQDAGVNAFVVAADEPRFDLGFGRPADRLRALEPVFRELAGMIKYRLTG